VNCVEGQHFIERNTLDMITANILSVKVQKYTRANKSGMQSQEMKMLAS
jgi:hypothetical protein